MTPDEVVEPDVAYLVFDEESDFDPNDTDPDPADADAPFAEKEVQDDGQD